MFRGIQCSVQVVSVQERFTYLKSPWLASLADGEEEWYSHWRWEQNERGEYYLATVPLVILYSVVIVISEYRVSWDRVVYQGAHRRRGIGWFVLLYAKNGRDQQAANRWVTDKTSFICCFEQHQRTATGMAGGTAGDGLNVDGWSHYSHLPRKSQSQSRRRTEYRTLLGLLLRVHREPCTLRWIDDGTRKYRAGGIKGRWVGVYEVKQQEDRQRWWMRDGPDSCSKFVISKQLKQTQCTVTFICKTFIPVNQIDKYVDNKCWTVC